MRIKVSCPRFELFRRRRPATCVGHCREGWMVVHEGSNTRPFTDCPGHNGSQYIFDIGPWLRHFAHNKNLARVTKCCASSMCMFISSEIKVLHCAFNNATKYLVASSASVSKDIISVILLVQVWGHGNKWRVRKDHLVPVLMTLNQAILCRWQRVVQIPCKELAAWKCTGAVHACSLCKAVHGGIESRKTHRPWVHVHKSHGVGPAGYEGAKTLHTTAAAEVQPGFRGASDGRHLVRCGLGPTSPSRQVPEKSHRIWPNVHDWALTEVYGQGRAPVRGQPHVNHDGR
mmetsp:Transcript_5174/g.15207  ORF Transcript_5174/g.15207 Transcript_5174/m.15207 type:complete len:287 (-) Transcript_5174:40-900(-)